MNDERLDKMFHELDNAHASPGFTQRVVARARYARKKRNQIRRATAAVMMTLTLVTFGAVAQFRAERAAEMKAFAAEERALRAELARLRTLTEEATRESVIYLGSSGEVEYVIDAVDLVTAAKNTDWTETTSLTERNYQ